MSAALTFFASVHIK